ncbi:J domain-containing protein [Treponema sp. R80B11-R83G3]
MGIFDRLGTIINSYFNDFGNETAGRFKSTGDPDYDAAYEELDDYLNRKEYRFEKEANKGFSGAKPSGAKLPPEELRPDFDLLGVQFGADNETCKAAYKNLLKIHHPDRHAGHEGNYKKATEKSAKINAAWDRIEKWRQTSKL